jgi:hypothetical protein
VPAGAGGRANVHRRADMAPRLEVHQTPAHRDQFVDRLLRVSHDGIEVACLDVSEIRFEALPFGPDPERILDDEDMTTINSWIHSVLECQIQMLRIDIDTGGCYEGYLQMSNMPLLVSRHLTRLELTGIWFCRCINLDGCPALEDLEIEGCDMLMPNLFPCRKKPHDQSFHGGHILNVNGPTKMMRYSQFCHRDGINYLFDLVPI